MIYLAIFCGMIYNGSHTGIGKQVISLIWWIVLIFISLHFYSTMASKVFAFMVQYWAKPLAFFILVCVLSFAIRLFNIIFNIGETVEMAPIERIGGAVVAALRSFLLFGVLSIMILLLPFRSYSDSVSKGSFSAMHFVNLDTAIYVWLTRTLDFVEDKEKESVVEEFLSSPERSSK